MALDKFRTGNGTLTGAVLYTLTTPNPLWFRAELADAINSMCSAENWEQVGTCTIDEAVQAAIAQARSFHTMIGQIIPYLTASAPDNTLPCDGTAYLRVDYPDLYAALDAAFVDDADNFHVPDLRGKTIIGYSATYAVGATGGETDHMLTVDEMPAHSHTDTGHSHTTGNSLLLGTSVPPPLDALGPNPLPAFTGSASANLTDTGGDGAHNNMQPYVALKYCVVAR